ncbi:MAG: hypothetical protein J4G13_01745 [Dehalococcoidia bacterium]|nr:hypothetical protein [Dehalococcoidia bacterium]
MATTLKPEMEARLAALARRLGIVGADAPERALNMAVDVLEAQSPPRRKPSPTEIAAEMEPIVSAARHWREAHPFDDDNPPSKVWQEELYDERGLPK